MRSTDTCWRLCCIGSPTWRPLLLYAVVVVVGSRGDGGPLLPLYALWTAALLISSTALTVIVFGSESIVQERITMVISPRRWLPLIVGVLVVLSFDTVLALLGLCFPLIVGVHAAGPADLLVGFAALWFAACAGVLVGVFCSRLFIPRPGYALLAGACLILALLLVPWLPVHLLIRLLAGGQSAGTMTGAVVMAAALAVGVLGAVLPVAWRLRRPVC